MSSKAPQASKKKAKKRKKAPPKTAVRADEKALLAPEEYPKAPEDADLSYITEDLRLLARPLEIVRPDPNNTKKHGSRDVGVVHKLYDKYTIRGAIVVQERSDGLMIRAGHGRWLAAKAAGHQYIPMVIIRGSTDELETAYGIEDNESAALVSVDREMVAKLLAREDQELEFVDGLYTEDDMSSILESSAKYASELTGDLEELESPDVEDHEPLGTGADTDKPGERGPVLKWGKRKIQLTEDEHTKLEKRFEVYYEAKGTPFGFVASLLRD